jgi:O-methyltransferase
MKKMFAQRARYELSLLLKLIFDRNSYIAHRDYVSTDYGQKCVHIMEAMNYAKVALLPKVYMEFGCHSGRTFSAAIRASRELGILEDTRFYAFDSFAGLPDTTDDDGIFKGGSFLTGIADFKNAVKKMASYEFNNDNIVAGFYSESLTTELQKELPKAGVIHIDVDLYSSAVEVLAFIKPLLARGSVLLFDDWYCFPAGSNLGEPRAFNEFLEQNAGIKVEEWKSYSSFGRSFFVTNIE